MSLLLAILVTAATHLPKANTRAEVQRYVEEAAKLVQRHGPACVLLASPAWRSNDYYIFVDGPNDNILCHANAAMIGKAPSTFVNSKGEKVGVMITAKAHGNGKGWVDYFWLPPGKKTEELKSSYVMGITGPDGKHYIVGAGGFNLK
jgi:signal transduction histidine kinase